ncbi:TIGR01457 family HAD-type hydrolase [Chungangia koreensis]|uniref:TIGR01457 family HAD-type hydrolase n=1 Tax=Chungangia koreensis TaxID=752657 RepID=A0ABV8X8E3_9LACT
MKRYKAYCFDLDGTVYRGDEPILEAVEFVNKLTRSGINPFFVTNNASKTPAQLLAKLTSYGIKTSESQIMTSAIAASLFIKEQHPDARVYMIGEAGLHDALVSQELNLVEKDADVFVMGIDRDITYEKLARACVEVRNGAKFIATNSDKVFPTERGLIPGNGSFVALIEAATDVKALYIGKPQPHLLEAIMVKHGFTKEEMVMIGDNYTTDILAGINFGIDTVHVNTGVTSAEQVKQESAGPTYYLEDLSQWKI